MSSGKTCLRIEPYQSIYLVQIRIGIAAPQTGNCTVSKLEMPKCVLSIPIKILG